MPILLKRNLPNYYTTFLHGKTYPNTIIQFPLKILDCIINLTLCLSNEILSISKRRFESYYINLAYLQLQLEFLYVTHHRNDMFCLLVFMYICWYLLCLFVYLYDQVFPSSCMFEVAHLYKLWFLQHVWYIPEGLLVCTIRSAYISIPLYVRVSPFPSSSLWEGVV